MYLPNFKFVDEHKHLPIVGFGINLALNAGIVAVGGISVAAVTYFALKALGFSSVATGVVTAIPVSIAAFGLAYTAAGFALSAGIIGLILYTIWNR